MATWQQHYIRGIRATLATLALFCCGGTASAATVNVNSTAFSYTLAFPGGGAPAKVTTVEGTFHYIGDFSVTIAAGTFTTPGNANGWVATAMAITLRMEDGDTAVGNFDRGRLFPVLGAGTMAIPIFDVPLNDFRNNFSDTITNVNNSLPVGTGANIAQLLSNVIDTNDGLAGINGLVRFYILDNAFSDNNLFFYSGQASQFQLSITLQKDLTAVPLPATLPLLISALAATTLLRRRS